MKPYESDKKFKHQKSLGQNFLKDPGAIEDIIAGSGMGEEDLVIEIGPGMGVLTREALKIAKRVVAIELDKRLIPILESELKGEKFRLINEDILECDIRAIVEEEKKAAEEKGAPIGRVIVLGNLPYYITTPIIMKLLNEETGVDSITVMMQKEVADRINAGPGSKAYGALTITVQYSCHVNRVVEVPKEYFRPVPKVDSTVLRLDLREEKPVQLVSEKVFFDCVKRGFSQRRKTLLNCFTGIYGMDKEETREQLEMVGIDPGARGEVLTMEDYAKLANHLTKEKEIGD